MQLHQKHSKDVLQKGQKHFIFISIEMESLKIPVLANLSKNEINELGCSLGEEPLLNMRP